MLKINRIREIASEILGEYIPDYELKFDLYKMTYKSDIIKHLYVAIVMKYGNNAAGTPDITISYGLMGKFDPLTIYSDGEVAMNNAETISQIETNEPYVAEMLRDLCDEISRLIKNNS